MDREKAKYVGVIWSNESSLEWLEKALSKAFSQPIYQGCFTSALGRKRDKSEEAIIEGTAGEIFGFLLWVGAAIGVIKEAPTALTILDSWLKEVNPEQAIAFVASHKELIDSVKKISERCGYRFRSWAVGGRKEMAKKEVAHTDEADLSRKALRKIEDRMNSLKEDLSVAQKKRDAAATSAIVKERKRLEAKRKELSKNKVILIRT